MTLAILSWGAHQTLINTLESYRKYGLDILDNDKVIFFQEYSKRDREIAQEYGYDSFGSSDNIGIAEAYKLLVNYASGDLLLFLENDWELIEEPGEQISKASMMLRNCTLDVAKFRHRKNPGAPLWSSRFNGQELSSLDAQHYLLDSVYWRENPEIFSPLIEKVDDWYFATSQNANWTNNPTMFRVSFLKEIILPIISGDIEVSIQDWWQKTSFNVGHGDGLFTHNRIDR